MASLKIKLNPDAKIVICQSDHVINDEKLFKEDMELALEHANEKTDHLWNTT